MNKLLHPKKLNFDEMWQLYKSIKNGIPEKEEEFLIQEISAILGNITDTEFKTALQIMYGDNFHHNRSAAEFALLFVKGIKKNELFSFASFIGNIHP